jgi:hypothetical protein
LAEFFIREVKDKRMTKNGPEFLIGWRDFPLEKDDTWKPKTFLTGSEHMVCEFQKQDELDYADRRKSMDEKNSNTVLDVWQRKEQSLISTNQTSRMGPCP